MPWQVLPSRIWATITAAWQRPYITPHSLEAVMICRLCMGPVKVRLQLSGVLKSGGGGFFSPRPWETGCCVAGRFMGALLRNRRRGIGCTPLSAARMCLTIARPLLHPSLWPELFVWLLIDTRRLTLRRLKTAVFTKDALRVMTLVCQKPKILHFQLGYLSNLIRLFSSSHVNIWKKDIIANIVKIDGWRSECLSFCETTWQ